jgi:hypothetical protein
MELIDQDTKWWNTHLINNIFHKEEARIICQIPLRHVQAKDSLIWCCTSNGEFSVQGAYHMEMISKPFRIIEALDKVLIIQFGRLFEIFKYQM